MIPGLDKFWLALGAVGGGVVAALSVFAWAHLVLVTETQKQTRAVVEAEAEGRTFDAIASVSDSAERNRAMRRYCASRQLRYDFATNQCGS